MEMDCVNPFISRYKLLPYITEDFLFGAFSSDLSFQFFYVYLDAAVKTSVNENWE